MSFYGHFIWKIYTSLIWKLLVFIQHTVGTVCQYCLVQVHPRGVHQTPGSGHHPDPREHGGRILKPGIPGEREREREILGEIFVFILFTCIYNLLIR